jgi:polar amino acid transport system substrate-binding protein
MTARGMDRRDFVRTAVVSTLLGGTAPILLAACSYAKEEEDAPGGTLARARRRGYINVGFANESPYAYTDRSGTLTGGSAQLAKVIFDDLGINEVRGVRLDFGEIIAGLIAGRCDTIAAGMFITPKRCALVTFADPDYCTKTAFLVPQGNTDGLHTFRDVAKQPGLRLGVLAGAVERDQAEAAGVQKSQIKTFTDLPDAFGGLETESIDAITLTRISLANLRRTHEGAPYEVTDPFIPMIGGKASIGCGAFAFRNEDAGLVQAWNGKLAELKSNGRLLQIIGQFGFTKDEYPGNHVAAEFC